MNTLVPILIGWLQLYGYPALWLCVFLSSAGAPLPSGLVLLAAGAFAALGDFNIFLLLAVASSAAVCGDSLGYWIGHRVGHRLLVWLSQSSTEDAAEPGSSSNTQPAKGADREQKRSSGRLARKKRRFHLISPRVIERSQEYFQRHGAWAVLLSRCVVPALGGTINILAGAERYPYRRFLLYDVIGQIIGAALPLTLGYIFGVSWEAIGTLLTTISLLVVALLVVIYLTILLVRMLQRVKIARQARKLAQVIDGSTGGEIRYGAQEDGLERQV